MTREVFPLDLKKVEMCLTTEKKVADFSGSFPQWDPSKFSPAHVTNATTNALGTIAF